MSRMKIYSETKNVYQASVERLEYIFDNFEKVYFSFSAGKDSTVMIHLALEVAKRKGKLPLNVLLIDLEAQYKATMKHATDILTRDDINAYWVCLPLNLRNAVSMYQPQWKCWDENEKDNWVREMPKLDCIINQHNMPEDWKVWWYEGMEFEEFIIHFGKWFSEGGSKLTACGVGIRADESLHRYLAVKKERDEVKFQKNGEMIEWTTQVKKNLYNFYPIYDWKAMDDWIYIGKNNLPYNKIYDFMYKAGRSINDMRICQPYGDDQKQGLDLFRKCEPETWGKVVERVAGANFGNIYRGLNILGNGKIIKPDNYTWKDYATFLLNTIPKYQAHIYKERIEQFSKWWEDNYDWPLSDFPDSSLPKNDIQLFRKGKQLNRGPSWERIAKCILKNDINCKSLSFGSVIGGYPRYLKLKEMYGE